MDQKSTKALQKSKMSLVGVVALIYSFVAAGAFGIEEAISASGPGLTIVMLVLFPIIWSFPISEMVGELSSIYPTEGGSYSWGREAFGEFWGWQVGFWSGLTTWLCQAQYCALIVGYASKVVGLNPTTEYLIKVVIVVIFTVVNIFGLNWLEKIETVFTAIVLFAFAAVAVVGFMNWNYNPMQPFSAPDVDLFHSIGDGIAIIIWMYCGYECLSNMSEEISNPQIIPRGMRWSQPVVALTYVLPTLAALAAIGSWTLWSTESGGGNVGYADVLIRYVGPWAGFIFIAIAIISNSSIFCSYIAHGSRAFFVMADDHMFPKIMKKVDRRGVPTVSIILLAIFTIITCKYDFTTLVMATTPVQMYIYLMLIACVVKIRKRYSVEKRKEMGLTVMPGGNFGLVLLSALVFTICMFALYASGIDFFLTGFVVLMIGLVGYIVCKLVYKGRAIDDPEVYPLHSKIKLGIGDFMDIGLYLILSGVLALLGLVFAYFYEGGYGVEYYLEEYGSGIFSDFYGMLSICKWIGIVLIVVGVVVRYLGKKTEMSTLSKLNEKREKALDDRIKELHSN